MNGTYVGTPLEGHCGSQRGVFVQQVTIPFVPFPFNAASEELFPCILGRETCIKAVRVVLHQSAKITISVIGHRDGEQCVQHPLITTIKLHAQLVERSCLESYLCIQRCECVSGRIESITFIPFAIHWIFGIGVKTIDGTEIVQLTSSTNREIGSITL